MGDAEKSQDELLSEVAVLRAALALAREEREHLADSLRDSEDRWRILMESAPNLITMTDPEGDILYINRVPSGKDPATAIGLNIFRFIPEHLRVQARSQMKEAADTGRAVTYEGGGTSPQGLSMWTQNTVSPLRRDGHVVGFLFVSTDITALKRSEERLRESERRLSRAQEIAHVGHWEWELVDGRVSWSDELYRIYGYDAARTEPSIEAFLQLLAADDRHRFEKSAILAEAQTRSPAEMPTKTVRITRPNGEVRMLRAQTEVIQRSEGRVVRLLGVTQDVTELMQANEQIALHTAELQKARELDSLKSNFVNAVTHELRTPLTSIRGYAEFLEDGIGGELTPQQLSFVRELEVGAQRLERLVDDLLDFARIEAGTFKLRIVDADLTARVREILASLEPQAKAARLQLAVEVPEVPVVLPMDAQRIGQVILNLMSNAIKFTPEGGAITLTVTVRDGWVRCAVTDTGIGIAPEDIPKLFQRFSQLESGVRSGGGTGLGLSISKAIVEAHRGSVGVTSRLHEGSTFWFTLPLDHHEPVEEPLELGLI